MWTDGKHIMRMFRITWYWADSPEAVQHLAVLAPTLTDARKNGRKYLQKVHPDRKAVKVKAEVIR